MDIEVKIVARRGEGALAKAAEVLTAAGFSFYDHSLKVLNEERAELELMASGDGDTEPLHTALLALDPILEIIHIREVATPAEGDDEAAEDEEIKDPWAERVANAWPDVLPLLQEFSKPLDSTERVHRLTALGVGVGRELYRRRTPRRPPTEIGDGLERVVLPALAPVARSKVRGSTIRVMETAFACGEMMDLLFNPVDDEGGYCCLLSGVIAGMLNEISEIKPVRVQETRCLAKGAPVCDFVVEKIPA